jgi:hypothetical protein
MTAGVAVLFAEALADLALLPWRVLLAVLLAGRRKREIAELIEASSRHAAQDPNPRR